MSSIFIVVFFLIYTSSGFVAGAKLFNTIFNLGYHYSLILTAVIVVSYTFLGGFNAVSWTDFFQGILMFFAILAVPIVVWLSMEGLSGEIQNLRSSDCSHLKLYDKTTGDWNVFIMITSNLAWGLGYFGQPHILARFMAISNANKVRKSRRIAIVWVFVSLCAAVVVGIFGRMYLNTELADSESVFLVLTNLNFTPLIAGIIFAGILAAIMSTADSQLLVSSSSVAEDLVKSFTSKGNSDVFILLVSRISVLIIAAISLIFAWNPGSSVLDMVSYAWAGFGATFGPLVILSLYSKNINRKGALAAMIGGGLTVLIWKNLNGGIFELYEIVPGFIMAGIFATVFSKNIFNRY